MKAAVLSVLLLAGTAVQAGTTVIHVETEGKGAIVKDTGAVNTNGAMVWSGTEWVVNNTWAHKYFVDTRTGLRLKDYTTTVVQGNKAETVTASGATVERRLVSYEKQAADGVYKFNAAEYRISKPAWCMLSPSSGLRCTRTMQLRSRGAGTGTGPAYFDVYIDTEGGGGPITAFRDDPVWYAYGPTLEQAAALTSRTVGRVGDLPTSGADYFLDLGGGSDLGPAGFGESFELKTGTLRLADAALGLGSSFIVEFSYKWMDESGNLQAIRCLPWADGRFEPASSQGCGYAVNPSSQTVPAAGGPQTLAVAATSGCSWNVENTLDWVTVTSAQAGAGNGQVAFTVAANHDGPRTGAFKVGGVTVVVEQAAPGAAITMNMAGSMAQIASGGPWKTSFTYVNTAADPVRLNTKFYGDSGSPLQLPVRLLSGGGVGPLQAPEVNRTLPAGGSVVMETEGTGAEATEVGWARLETSGAAGGYAIFRAGGQEAVVPLESRNAAKYVLWYDNTAGFVTSMALANADTHPASVAATTGIQAVVKDENGTIIETQALELPPEGHTAFELVKRFPKTAGRRGTIEFATPTMGRISLLGLRFNANSFTTIPVLTKAATDGGTGSMAQIASGGGWKTTMTLVNLGATSATAKLCFFNDAGAPLTLDLTFPAVAGGGKVTGTSIERTISAGASLVIESEGAGGVQAGWTQLETAGNVSGFAIFRSGGQEAVVPVEMRTQGSSVVCYDNTPGFVTSVAAVNPLPGQAITDVIIRDEAGVITATDTLDLPGRGHTATELNKRFPQTANGRGTIEFRPRGSGQTSVLGLRFNDTSFTTVPVLAK